MKANSLFLSLVLLIANHAISQTAQKKEMGKRKDSIPPIVVEKTLVTQPNLVPASSINSKPKTALLEIKNTNLVTNDRGPVEKKSVVPLKEGIVPPAPNFSKASLLDAFVTVSTGTSTQTFPVTSGDNKDPDTHWSCGIFDQNGRPISSFHDDSNTDEYVEGSITGPLQMHIDNAAVFGDFSNGGHLHINIAPNGNDTWGITS